MGKDLCAFDIGNKESPQWDLKRTLTRENGSFTKSMTDMCMIKNDLGKSISEVCLSKGPVVIEKVTCE